MEFIDERIIKLISGDNEMFEITFNALKLSTVISEQLDGKNKEIS